MSFSWRKVMTPITVVIVDGSDQSIAEVSYNVQDDIVRTETILQGSHLAFPFLMRSYSVGNREKFQSAQTTRPTKRLLITRLPFEWVANRTTRAQLGFSMLDDSRRLESVDFLVMDDLNGPTCVNIHYFGPHAVFDNWNINQHRLLHPVQMNSMGNGQNETRFDVLPVEIFEHMLPTLDDATIISMYKASPRISKLMNEAMSLQSFPEDRCRIMFTDHLDHGTTIKIMRSYDHTFRGRDMGAEVVPADFKDLVLSYLDQHMLILGGECNVSGLNQLGQLVMQELRLFYIQSSDKSDPQTKSVNFFYDVGCGGGGTFYVCIFPYPTNLTRQIKLVCTDDMDTCMNPIISRIEYYHRPTYFASKLMDIPAKRTFENGQPFPAIDRILVAVSDMSITPISILGDFSRRGRSMIWSETLRAGRQNEDFIFETHKNVVAVWIDPEQLVFLVLLLDRGESYYEFNELYHLDYEDMHMIHKKLRDHMSNFIVEIREFRGPYRYEVRGTMGLHDYPFRSDYNVYYGLAFVSHLYGVHVFKPRLQGEDDVMESYSPKYYPSQVANQLSLLGDSLLSCKGHGIYIFANAQAVTISWDGITWLYSRFNHGLDQDLLHMRTINVIDEEVFVVSINEYLQFYKISVSTGDPVFINDLNVTEPNLEVIQVRQISLNFSPRDGQIVKVEYDFAEGNPFFLATISRNTNNNVQKVGKMRNMCINALQFIRINLSL